MNIFKSSIEKIYDRFIISHPWKIIACLSAVFIFCAYHANEFKIDASSDTLVKEGDKAFQYAEAIYSRYGVQDFLFIAYLPRKDLLSDAVLMDIAALRDELKTLKRVDSVVTILDVPLLQSPPMPIKEMISNIRTLASPDVDRDMARMELKNSPLYQNLLVSPDLKATALQVNFKIDHTYRDLMNRRDNLRKKASGAGLTDAETRQYNHLLSEIEGYKKSLDRQRHEDIAAVRAIMDKHRKDADLFLGGVSMIADDLITFVKNDLKTFGVGVFVFLILMMGIIFHQIRWILIPMICCAVSAVIMMGLLGLFGWKVTVISSNFIAIQLVLTMSLTIHLIVRYREMVDSYPHEDQRRLVLKTIMLMITPCLYNSLTTIAGFGSLVFCDIKPVVSFGWMMTAGVAVSFIVTFLFFPSCLVLFKKSPRSPSGISAIGLSPFMGRLTHSHTKLILACFSVLFVFSVLGGSQLVVENAFINYFKESTEIYQGMKVIDQQLGGTTPLDVIIDFTPTQNLNAAGVEHDDFDHETPSDDFDAFDEFDKDQGKKYWFTPYKMDKITRVHQYLESLPEVGKVLSLGNLMEIAKNLNGNEPLDSFNLSLLYNEMPEKYKEILVKPFVSIENDQVRFFVRIRDSAEGLRRNELIHRIYHDLITQLGYKPDKVHLTGMLVLYNNMLQSLFDSQIKTIGIVLLVLMFMFLLLFQSLRVAIIAVFPNLLSISAVLGFMGWAKLPLDMMTITIASISVGIAVDDTIHYIHRFKKEFHEDPNYIRTMHRCHGSIGYAMFYTTITIVIGFSILIMSNFIPSIYFGLLTGVAMVIALIAALTLLPALIIIIKPFGPEPKAA